MRETGSRNDHSTQDAGARKVVLAALAGNLAIAVIKFAAWAFSGSAAMLTEGIHSLVDTGDQVLLLVGQRRAAKAVSETHPFGYGMETYFWSFIVALMIFLVGGVVAVWQGVEKLLHPEAITSPGINFAVLAVAAACEGLSFRTAYREFRQIVRGRDVRLFSFLRVSKDPNVFATLLEDGAALTGLLLAALGVAGSTFLGWRWTDGAASVLIGLLLIAVAAFLANETRSLIAGEAASPITLERVREVLKGLDRLGEAADVRTLHLGPRTILVTICWRFRDSPGLREIEAAWAEIKAAVGKADERICDVLFDISGPPSAQRRPVSSATTGSSAGDAPRPDRRVRPRGSPG
jgi:cation diffusion facilitator family transporter